MSHHILFSATFVGCLSIGMLLLLEVGRRLGTRGKHDQEEAGAGFGAVEGAVFGLLGLLIAFTFSGAADRFNTRRSLIADEANAAVAAYMYADLLVPESRRSVREGLQPYVDLRIIIYRKLPDIDNSSPELLRSEELRKQIWTEALAARSASSLESNAPLFPALVRLFELGSLRIVANQNSRSRRDLRCTHGVGLCLRLAGWIRDVAQQITQLDTHYWLCPHHGDFRLRHS